MSSHILLPTVEPQCECSACDSILSYDISFFFFFSTTISTCCASCTVLSSYASHVEHLFRTKLSVFSAECYIRVVARPTVTADFDHLFLEHWLVLAPNTYSKFRFLILYCNVKPCQAQEPHPRIRLASVIIMVTVSEVYLTLTDTTTQILFLR